MKTQIFLIILCACFCSVLFAQTADNKQNFSIIPDNCEFMTLYNAKDIEDLKEYNLFLSWHGAPYIIKGKTIIGLLPDSIFQIFELPDKSSPSQIICTKTGITYLKTNNLIQIMEDNIVSTLLTMKDANFQINLADEQLLYITTYSKDSSKVFLFDIKASQIVKLFAIAGKVNDIAGDGFNTYVAIGHKIFLLSNNHILKVMDIEQDITMFAWTEYGLFFSTTKNIGYIVNSHEPLPFTTKPAKKLLPFGNQMYIQFEDGTISILFGLEYFESFVNSVYNN